MCQCTPNIRTPFCGKGDCQWPAQIKRDGDLKKDQILSFSEFKAQISPGIEEAIGVDNLSIDSKSLRLFLYEAGLTSPKVSEVMVKVAKCQR